jgi:hypothetical protein
VVLFADDLQDFLKGFDESLRVMEKAVRDKKKEARPERPARTERQDRSDRTERDFSERGASEREFSVGEKARQKAAAPSPERDSSGMTDPTGDTGKTLRPRRGIQAPEFRPFRRLPAQG